MPNMKPYKDYANDRGIPVNAVYQGIRQGILPAWRIGAPGTRGRFLVDVDLCDKAIAEQMMANCRPQEQQLQPYIPVRNVRKLK